MEFGDGFPKEANITCGKAKRALLACFVSKGMPPATLASGTSTESLIRAINPNRTIMVTIGGWQPKTMHAPTTSTRPIMFAIGKRLEN